VVAVIAAVMKTVVLVRTIAKLFVPMTAWSLIF